LAAAYVRRSDYLAARKQLMRAYSSLVSTPDSGPAMTARIANNLGVCYERMGDLHKAQRFYEVAASKYPQAGPIAFQNLARVLMRLSDLDGADQVLTEALKHYPQNARLGTLRASLHYEREEYDDALVLLRTLVQSSGAYIVTFGLLSSVLTEAKQAYADALAVLEDARSLFGLDLNLANSLAYTELMAGHIEAAREILSKHYDREEESVTMVATRGLYEIHSGSHSVGEAMYVRASELARKQGSPELALQALQKMHLELARDLLQTQRSGDAKRHVKLGLAIPFKRGLYRAHLKEMAIELGVI
jgi:tetratricopeptide (TPR) repeat protein